MHGLVFKTSICYWQDQPGSPLSVVECRGRRVVAEARRRRRRPVSPGETKTRVLFWCFRTRTTAWSPITRIRQPVRELMHFSIFPAPSQKPENSRDSSMRRASNVTRSRDDSADTAMNREAREFRFARRADSRNRVVHIESLRYRLIREGKSSGPML